MAGALVMVLTVLSVGLFGIAVAYVFGLRSKSSSVRDVARRFHRAVGNPLQMRRAGTPGTFASVIRHRGRTTGRIYETPVWAAPTEDGFVIAIVYGPRSDWLKNVSADGTATLIRHGDAYLVGRPEIVPMESVRAYFPVTLQRIHRRIRVDQCLRVRRLELGKVSTASGGLLVPNQEGGRR
jgi:hypothetical protein